MQVLSQEPFSPGKISSFKVKQGKIWKQAKYPTADEWIKKMCLCAYIHTHTHTHTYTGYIYTGKIIKFLTIKTL